MIDCSHPVDRVWNPAAKIPAQPSSIERDDWETPIVLFEIYHDRHRFTIDVAANAKNARVKRFFSREDDGLKRSWAGERVWMHPPHGDVAQWCEKAHKEAARGTLVVGLIPVRTDADWWMEHVYGRTESLARIRFLVSVGWRLNGLPLDGQRRVEGPRGAFCIAEWHR